MSVPVAQVEKLLIYVEGCNTQRIKDNLDLE